MTSIRISHFINIRRSVYLFAEMSREIFAKLHVIIDALCLRLYLDRSYVQSTLVTWTNVKPKYVQCSVQFT